MINMMVFKTALSLALGTTFIEIVFLAEGTRCWLAPGPYYPYSRPGRLVFLLASLVLLRHSVEYFLPKMIA